MLLMLFSCTLNEAGLVRPRLATVHMRYPLWTARLANRHIFWPSLKPRGPGSKSHPVNPPWCIASASAFGLGHVYTCI